MLKWILMIILCLALIVSISFNILQARRYNTIIWWSEHSERKIKEFSVGHGLLTNGPFFGDARKSFVAMQVQFICNTRIVDKYDLIAIARVWDGINIGWANLENKRKDENSSKLTKDEKHQVRINSYQTDILPRVKNGVQTLCGKKDDSAYTALQEFNLEALYQNIGYAIFE